MKISIIQPGRNNLKYLKWSYDSIRQNQGNHEVEICIADDFSNDGTWDWCNEMMKKDSSFKAIRNEGPTRLGHTILYDTLVNEVATHDICMIYHADMYLCPGAIDSIEWNLKPKTIVSLTRIEPPLHPPGLEKILEDFGIEPEEFNEPMLLNYLESSRHLRVNKTTEGIFAPWAFYKKDFEEIGGHDPLYAPQSKEDTDIFNRFQLNGIKFIQTWEGCVYHMTCRGSRFADGAIRNPDGEVIMKNRETDEWLVQNEKSTLEFIRKWGHLCKHDEYLKPIVPSKYNLAIVLRNSTDHLLSLLEPYSSVIYCDYDPSEYVKEAQKKSSFDIAKRCLYRVETFEKTDLQEDIKLFVDGNTFQQSDMDIVSLLTEIIDDSGTIGSFEIGNLKVQISKINKLERDLILCES